MVIESAMDVPTIAFGFSLGFLVLTAMKAARQTIAIYKRTQRIWNAYSWMVWIEIVDNLVMTVYTWCYLRGNIKPSFAFFFGLRKFSKVHFLRVDQFANTPLKLPCGWFKCV